MSSNQIISFAISIFGWCHLGLYLFIFFLNATTRAVAMRRMQRVCLISVVSQPDSIHKNSVCAILQIPAYRLEGYP